MESPDSLTARGTATGFAEWVFWKTNPHYLPRASKATITERKALGIVGHSEIDQLHRWMIKVEVANDQPQSWKLIYSDPHDVNDGRVFLATSLLVDNEPVRCKPDVVLKNSETGQILVLERKITVRDDIQIPAQAWPNIRAQLWCYAWIDDWIDAQDVILICQFYRRRVGDGPVRTQDSRNPWILNYKVHPGWRRSQTDFHSEILGYFNDYGGKFCSRQR